jgi:hypothetical protein
MGPFPSETLNTIHVVTQDEAREIGREVERLWSIDLGDLSARPLVYDLFQRLWEALPAEAKAAPYHQIALWDELCSLLRSFTGFAGPIDRETTFFAEHATARTHHG